MHLPEFGSLVSQTFTKGRFGCKDPKALKLIISGDLYTMMRR